MPLFQKVSVQNLSYENEFCMQFHFHANQNNFHKNGFGNDLYINTIYVHVPLPTKLKWDTDETQAMIGQVVLA